MSDTVEERDYNFYQDEYDIYAWNGETFTLVLQYCDDDEIGQDISAYSAGMEVRSQPGGEVLLDFSTGTGSGIVLDSSGYITLSKTSAQMQALAFQDAPYDMYIKSAAGTVIPLLRGTFHVIPNITEVT